MKKIRIVGMCLSLFAIMSVAQEEGDGRLKNTISVGLTLTDGNSETMQANVSLVTAGEKDGLGSVRAGLEAHYGESAVGDRKDTTVENARLFANAKKTISPMTFASLDGALLYDAIADIDYRAVIAPGLGVYLVKDEQTSLFFEAGPAYVWEKVGGESEDYLALRFAERLEFRISQTSKLWQVLEYLPKADDVSSYLLNAELGAEAAMNARINLRLVLQNNYDSTPGDGLEKNDITLIAGISLSL